MAPYEYGRAMAKHVLGFTKTAGPVPVAGLAQLARQTGGALGRAVKPALESVRRGANSAKHWFEEMPLRPGGLQQVPEAAIQDASHAARLRTAARPTAPTAKPDVAPPLSSAAGPTSPTRLQRNAIPLGIGFGMGLSDTEDGTPSWGAGIRGALMGGVLGLPGVGLSLAYPYVRKALSRVAPESAPAAPKE